MRRLLVPLLIALTAVAACADPNAQPGRADPTVAEPAPTELLTDGSVPWADLKITGEDLNGRPAEPRTPAAGSEPCRAEQLTGRLTTWTRPGTGGETPRGFDAAIGKLIGEVDVRNSSTVECALQAGVPTTMLAGGREIPMLYAHGIDEEGRTRVVAVPAGGHASLRLDWSGPFCQPVKGSLELAIELPHDGGRLRAPVTADERPGCPQGEGVNPRARGTLSASGFTEPVAVSKPPSSPLEKLTVAVQGPTTAVAGSRLTFRVTLGNPTDGPLALDPCPAYLMERFSRRRDERRRELGPVVPAELPRPTADPRWRHCRVRNGRRGAGLDAGRARADRDVEALSAALRTAEQPVRCRDPHRRLRKVTARPAASATLTSARTKDRCC